MAPPRAVVFDLYGTLVDVGRAMAAHAVRLGPAWPSLTAEWRARQLEIAWVRSLTGTTHHQDFWLCTVEALDLVLAAAGIRDAKLRGDLLDSYHRPPAYPEVPGVLCALREAGRPMTLLSNASPWMIGNALASAGIAGSFEATLSVEEAGVFKPHPRVYAMLQRHLGLPAEDVLYVASNAWDVQAAAHAGFRAVRLNRHRRGDEYGLAQMGVPDLPDLGGVMPLAGA